MLAGFTLVYWLSILCYFGPSASWDSFHHKLVIRIISFDDGTVGQAYTACFQAAIDSPKHARPGYRLDSSTLETTTSVIASVNDGAVWGAVIVHAGASASLSAALRTGDASYDATKAITVVYDEGRAATIVGARIVLPIQQVLGLCNAQFAARSLMEGTASDPALVTQAALQSPAVLVQPVGYSLLNLHPFRATVTNAGLMVGMILMMVFSMMSTMAIFGPVSVHFVNFTPIKRWAVRASSLAILACSISFSFAIILSILGAKFQSPGNWISFAIVQWLVMLIFSYIFAAVATYASPQQVPLAFFPLLILNAATGLSVLDLASPFYLWGYALPLVHSCMASRTLLYGSYDRLYMNIPMLCVWFAGTFGLFMYVSLKHEAPLAVGAAGHGEVVPRVSDHGNMTKTEDGGGVH